jgi:hypothetical protein
MDVLHKYVTLIVCCSISKGIRHLMLIIIVIIIADATLLIIACHVVLFT